MYIPLTYVIFNLQLIVNCEVKDGAQMVVAEELENTLFEKFRTQIYTISDFVGWQDRGELTISPSFQRRRVWTHRGKSYLIDTIVRGMPIPPIFIRQVIHPSLRRTVREVVDGQQRISAILDFINGEFTVLPSHNSDIAKQKYDALPEHVQGAILSYPLSVNVLNINSDADVLDVFARLNSYSLPLNAAEKLNAKYTGAFRNAMNLMARKHLAYWSKHKILGNQQIARMGDVELTADLVVTMMTKLQSGRTHIEPFYKKYDDEFPQERVVASQFDHTLSIIEELAGVKIEETELRRVTLFYSLFTAVYDIVFGFGCSSPAPEKILDGRKIIDATAALQELNDKVAERETEGKVGEFVNSTRGQTTNLEGRQLRHEFMKSLIAPAFVSR